MVELLVRLVINALLLLIVAGMLPGLFVEGWGSAFISSSRWAWDKFLENGINLEKLIGQGGVNG